MRFFRKKPAPLPAVIPETIPTGLFNIEIDAEGMAKEVLHQLNKAMGKSFQRTINSVKPMIEAADGTYAMDESYPDLQTVKIQNSLGGGFLNETQLIWYANQAFIGYQACALISQNWLIDKAITMPARDATRHGYDITVNDGTEIEPDIMVYMRQRDKAMKLKSNCVEFIREGRRFGIRIALMEVDIPNADEFYLNPFNIDAVKPGSYKGISQIDPYWITPELDVQAAANPASKHFYEPTWWRINGKRVHRTHLIINRNGDELPDILKPTYFYGGIPVPQKIAERVFAAERTANEAPMLAMTKRLTVLKTDITQAAANADEFTSKMGFWASLMNNFGIKVVGDGEEVEQFDTSLTDVDTVIMTQFQLVAAAAEVPATKLLGTSPKGFGASGEYEEDSYHEFLESMQEHELSPLVNRHHMLLMKSEIQPKFGKYFETEVSWKETDTPTKKEQAEIGLLDAQRDNQLVQAGAIDGTDVRMRIIADPESGYTGIEEMVEGGPGDREAQQEAEAALEQPVQAKAKGDAKN